MKTNSNSRRKFITNSLAVGSMLPLINNPIQLGNKFIENEKTQVKSLKILLLGGTKFLGPHQIACALKRGHSVSTFTRGKTKPTIHKELFNEVEQLIGDRIDNLEALKGRKWDVVIDNSGNRVQWTKDTAQLLKDNTDLYMYTSSISVYYPYTGTDFSEKRKLILEMPDNLESEDEKLNYDYGMMKANSEIEVQKAYGEDRAIAIRPHFIVGPADPTNRFTYWPVRLEMGGEVLLPGKTNDYVQYIDVRDLAEWMIKLLENKTAGTFNATGPGTPMTMPQFIYGGHAAYNSPISYVHIDDYDFLREHQIPFACPWVLPEKKYKGMSLADNSLSKSNGLTFRPLADTMNAITEWWHSDAVDEAQRDSLLKGEQSLLSREKEVIQAWKNRK